MECLVILLALFSISSVNSYSIGIRWLTNNLTWKLINYQNLSTIFEKAFKTWSDVANITFTQTNGSTYDISIKFDINDL
jgi:hypothetical protein